MEHDGVANCWWHPVSDELCRTWAGDEQMLPVAMLLEEPFPSIAGRSVSSSVCTVAPACKHLSSVYHPPGQAMSCKQIVCNAAKRVQDT